MKRNIVALSGYTLSSLTKVKKCDNIFFKRFFNTLELNYLKNKEKIVPQKYISKRPFFNSIFNTTNKRSRHEEKHLLGYSIEQMYSIAAEVQHYRHFVPWCIESSVFNFNPSKTAYKCTIAVGFPPLVERYTSNITVKKPHIVKSVCSDAHMFNHLLTIWKFEPGLDNREDTCIVDFFVEFEFKYSLHSQVAQLFYDEVIKQMVRAFFRRAKVLHGNPSINSRKIK